MKNIIDGDVQALIEKCRKDIAQMKSWHDSNDYSQDIRIYEIALAALTAEPETPACFVTYWPDTDDESDRPHSESNESCARRIAGEIGGYVRPCFILDDGMKAYTTPPAQILRPVELPVVKTARAHWSTWNWIEHLGGRFQNGNPGDYIEFGSVYAVSQMLKQYRRTVTAEVIYEISESLRQQGYEVKND